jgi:serine O-acetyltransferase
MIEKLRMIVTFPFVIPYLIIMTFVKNDHFIWIDIARWSQILDEDKTSGRFMLMKKFCKYMIFFPEFRSLFYFRFKLAKLISFILKPMPNLYIYTKDIGPGLFIQHGFSTIISAKKIGKNCWINQQVTIGYSNKADAPIIGDFVTIHAGAKIIGNVTIGSNSKVGAASVVVRDVPPHCVVVGVPGKVVRKNGLRVFPERGE